MKIYFRQMIACALIGSKPVFGDHRNCDDCKVNRACLDLWKKVQPLLAKIDFSAYEEVK